MRKGNAIGWRGSHRFQCNTPPAFGGRKRNTRQHSRRTAKLLLLLQRCRGHAACGTAFLNALHGALVLTLPKRSSRWLLRATFWAGKSKPKRDRIMARLRRPAERQIPFSSSEPQPTRNPCANQTRRSKCNTMAPVFRCISIVFKAVRGFEVTSNSLPINF